MTTRYFRKWDQGTIDSGWPQVSLVGVFCLVDSLLGLFYHTIYFYVMVFAPIFVIFYSRTADAWEHRITDEMMAAAATV